MQAESIECSFSDTFGKPAIWMAQLALAFVSGGERQDVSTALKHSACASYTAWKEALEVHLL